MNEDVVIVTPHRVRSGNCALESVIELGIMLRTARVSHLADIFLVQPATAILGSRVVAIRLDGAPFTGGVIRQQVGAELEHHRPQPFGALRISLESGGVERLDRRRGSSRSETDRRDRSGR